MLAQVMCAVHITRTGRNQLRLLALAGTPAADSRTTCKLASALFGSGDARGALELTDELPAA